MIARRAEMEELAPALFTMRSRVTSPEVTTRSWLSGATPISRNWISTPCRLRGELVTRMTVPPFARCRASVETLAAKGTCPLCTTPQTSQNQTG